ncbi:MAG: hypothetical protein ACWGNB_05555, partial [Thiogranum sp.]
MTRIERAADAISFNASCSWLPISPRGEAARPADLKAIDARRPQHERPRGVDEIAALGVDAHLRILVLRVPEVPRDEGSQLLDEARLLDGTHVEEDH